MHDKPAYSTLLGVRVNRTIMRCSGVKVCAQAAEYVKQSHSSWSGSDFEKKNQVTDKAQRVFAGEFYQFDGQERSLL